MVKDWILSAQDQEHVCSHFYSLLVNSEFTRSSEVCNKARKRKTRNPDEKEDVRLFLFTDMLVYKENPMRYTIKGDYNY